LLERDERESVKEDVRPEEWPIDGGREDVPGAMPRLFGELGGDESGCSPPG